MESGDHCGESNNNDSGDYSNSDSPTRLNGDESMGSSGTTEKTDSNGDDVGVLSFSENENDIR